MAGTQTQGGFYGFDINGEPPIVDPANGWEPFRYGVVKVVNIPYAVTLQEINHFVSRLSKGPLLTPHVHGFPVHAIIERPTGKTLEIYVEFRTHQAAAGCVARTQNANKQLKLGHRRVSLELSSQGELMSVLFPRARCVEWEKETGFPHIVPGNESHPQGFCGFFTIEEIASVVKHAETPQRSPFSARCMQRTYESMISTLYKFPWSSTANYTVAARNYLYSSYMSQLRVLVAKVAPDDTPQHFANSSVGSSREVGLSHSLLMDFLFAGLNVPCFSMRQKFHIAASCGSIGYGFPLSSIAFSWPFQCLTPTPNAPQPLLEFWLEILSNGFELMQANGITHGYEQHLDVSRDGCGFVSFDFTATGSTLKFSDAIQIEKATMERMIENGRLQYCVDRGVPYQSLNILGSSSTGLDTDLGARLDMLDLGAIGSRPSSSRQSLSHSGAGPLVVRPDTPELTMSPNRSGDALRRQFSAGSNLSGLPAANAQSRSSNSASQTLDARASYNNSFIDPTTPEFVPSETWAGAGKIDFKIPLLQDEGGLGTNTGFCDPFASQSIPTPRPSVTSTKVSPENRESSTSSSSDHALISTASGSHPSASARYIRRPGIGNGGHHDPIGTPRPSSQSSDYSPSADRGRARRKAINIAATIDEEADSSVDEHGGGVRLQLDGHE